MLADKKKQIFLALLLIIILMFLSFSLLAIYVSKKNQNQHTPSGLYIAEFNPTNTVKLKNILPVSDKLGKEIDGQGTKDGVQGYVEISIENTDNVDHSYVIYLTKNQNKNEINGNFVVCYLTDGDDIPLTNFEKNIIPSYDELEFLLEKPDSKFLARVKLSAGEKKNYKLRSWVADTYVISLQEEDFEFTVGVLEE